MKYVSQKGKLGEQYFDSEARTIIYKNNDNVTVLGRYARLGNFKKNWKKISDKIYALLLEIKKKSKKQRNSSISL